MVDFAGWSMPVQYGSIIDEHHATRKSIGLFDVSHMGRLYFSGDEVESFLDRMNTRRIAGVEAGKIRYSLLTNEEGKILDDVLVYHLSDSANQAFYMMVVNASNREKVVNWLRSDCDSNAGTGLRIEIEDRTERTAMIAVQGPLANQIVAKISDLHPESLPYYTGATTKVLGHAAIISRTGYTGEDGCELIVAAEVAAEIWERLNESAKTFGGGPAGLAARDTLRLEAGMPLYGHELSEEINAAQTNLNFAIQFKDREFVGKSAILAAKQNDSLPVRVGLELIDRRPAREGCDIYAGEEKIGFVTSGTFSPTLQKSISMGYVSRSQAVVGTSVSIDVRGKTHAATVVALPFYQRS